ncbi:restriction endonuclease subunit S [Bengtsoniella intestinalis]|uniref:restriction endonuclease subunit S n=1 Tax=Bengtsoniella intestinalis TaxID=3073143 RepID=UPI00391F53F9
MGYEQWKTVPASEFCTVVTDGTHDSPKQVEDGYYLITSKHLNEFSLNFKDAYKISESDYKQIIVRSGVEYGDILFSMIGTIGRIYLERGAPDYAIKNVGLFKLGSDMQKSLWLYYWLKSPATRAYIESRKRGSTQGYVPLGALRELPVAVPPLPTQQKIAKILSSLDDKIELNNRMNANLEAQAQAIYREMFCSEGCCEDIGILSQLISIKYGKDHKKLDDGIFPVYGSGGIMRYAERFLYDGETVLVPRKGTLNNVIYLNEPFWSVDTMFYTEMKQPNSAKFVYHFLKGKDLSSMNAGTAVPSMTTEILNGIQLYIPAQEKLDEFETIASPIYRILKRNAVENQHLAQLRDTLLPRLMSGEIDVESVEGL